MNTICFGDSNTYGYDPAPIWVSVIIRTADGWIFWLQRPDGQSITWARMAGRFLPLLQTSLLIPIC